ncbi:hypothetical protein [uncultured Desulfovibrio sp.]|uniref:hypothetical protein n=1 Tax=uncultured Desulfovibrio sp. TaxID=167968 RepID=UPI002671DC39|nr:hypothetical protein [uncultured Desulfovibrio sp.]
MNWKDVGNVVSKAAPILGTILGGPAGAAAGGAASLIASMFGCEPEPEAVMQALKKDPEALVKIKELEVQNRANILQWKTAQIQAEVDDRKSARQASVDGGDRTRLFWLSIFLFVVAFGLEGALLFFGFAVGISGELVGRVMGTVDTLAVMVGTFWFGTSRSSQNSEALLYQSTPPTVQAQERTK